MIYKSYLSLSRIFQKRNRIRAQNPRMTYPCELGVKVHGEVCGGGEDEDINRN